jgi:Ca-activated chloride channel family protein
MSELGMLGAIAANFHFLRPLWLLALIPAFLLVFYLWRLNQVSSAWDKAIDKELLPFLLDNTKSVAERTPLMILLTLWTLAILALAGPVWEQLPQPVQARQDALVIVYDQSLSMYAQDLDPNRQTVSKRKLLDVLDNRLEGQTALIVYAGGAHAVTPLTEDSITIKALVPSINPNMMPAFGSNTVAAIEVAKELFADAGALSGTILLITDGVERRDHAALADLLAQTGYRLAILGIGTEQGAPIPAAGGDFLRDASGQIVQPGLDRASLQDLAALVNGRYSDLEITSADVDYLLDEDAFLDSDELTAVDENFDLWYEVGPWLLILILPLSTLMFRRGWIIGISLGMGLVSMMTPTTQVHAADWQDLWKTSNQQAAEAYADEDPATAAMLFRDPAWRGAAAYHAGDYATAIQAFSSNLGTEAVGHYNLGNAYAQAQNFEAAVASYDIALSIDPEHEDAIHNREIVAALLEQQQEQQQDQPQQDGMQTEQQDQERERNEENESDEEQQEQEQDQDQQEEESGDEQENQEESEQNESTEQEPNDDQEPGEDPQMSNADMENQESLEQWLRRINDDPGELLQRKFQFEYRRRQLESRSTPPGPESQIW